MQKPLQLVDFVFFKASHMLAINQDKRYANIKNPVKCESDTPTEGSIAIAEFYVNRKYNCS